MPFELKDIEVSMISLVKAGANGKTVILKSADQKPPDFEKTLVVKAVNGTLYGVVYSPDEVDLQGDFAAASEIRKAAYSFMKTLGNLNIDANHDGQKRPAYVAESWLVRKGDPIFPDEKEGAWAVGIQLDDPALIAAVEKGEIAGLSMAGTASRIAAEKTEITTEKSIMEKILKALEGFGFRKADPPVPPDAEPKAEPEPKAVDTAKLVQAIGDGLSKLQDQITDLASRMGDMEKAVAKSRQNTAPTEIDKSGQDADEKLGAEMASLVKRR